MTAQLIDGNALSEQLRTQVAARAQALKAQGITPGLAVILVGDNPASQVYVRNKRPAGVASFAAGKTLIYVHGATYPSETAFDLKLDGLSWMDYIARQGYDVYLLDVRGYGQSTRPPVMDRPAAEGQPFAGTEEAMRDVDAVVEFVRKRRGDCAINVGRVFDAPGFYAIGFRDAGVVSAVKIDGVVAFAVAGFLARLDPAVRAV